MGIQFEPSKWQHLKKENIFWTYWKNKFFHFWMKYDMFQYFEVQGVPKKVYKVKLFWRECTLFIDTKEVKTFLIYILCRIIKP